MIAPRKIKFNKMFRGKLKGFDYKVSKLAFGNIGIKTLKSGRISAKQLDAVRKLIIKKLKSKTKIWIRVFPYLPVTAKPTEVRMGKGKGSLAYWCCPIQAGRILFELSDLSISLRHEILSLVKYKFSVPVKLVYF
jgi:large subunit ribosomal protein L16